MQIHISWKALLAGLILLIGLGLVVRTVALFFTSDDPVSAATSPSPVAELPGAGTAAPTEPVVAGSTITAVAGTPSPSATVAPAATPTGTATSPATATPSPTLTAQPEPTQPTASPTPFQPPTREPTPVPASIVIVAQGFGQRPAKVSYGFVVENPNPNLMAQNIRYQVAAYDAAGTVLLTDSDTITQVGPGQQMGVGKELSLASNLVVTRIDVLIRPGQFVQSPPLQLLEVSNAAFVDGEPPNVTGVLTNPLARDLADLTIVGIAYDDVGIVGGGTAVLPFAPAGGQAPVSVPVVTSQQVTRIQFFAPIGAAPVTTGP